MSSRQRGGWRGVAFAGGMLAALVLGWSAWHRPPGRIERRKTRLGGLARLDGRPGSLIASEDGRHFAYIVGRPGATAVMTDGVLGPWYDDCSWVWLARGGGNLRTYFARASDKRFSVVAGAEAIPIGFTKRDWLSFSPDGAHYALLADVPEADGATSRPVMILRDGRILGTYPDASVAHYDPSGVSVAYLVPGADGGVVLMKDGVAVQRFPPPRNACTVMLPPPDQGAGMPRLFETDFLSDGRTLALTTDADGWAVYRDGERLGSYDAITPGPGAELTFSIESAQCLSHSGIAAGSLVAATTAPVGAWWARPANERPDLGATWQVVRDGKPIGASTCIRPWDTQRPVLSADGGSVAYPCVVSAIGANETIFVVHDDRWYGPYANVYGVALSDDGRRLAFAASYGEPDDWRLYVDGRPLGHQYVGFWRPRFSPDGRHVAWQAQRSRNDYDNELGIDGVRLSRFENVGAGPVFRSDGAIAWVISLGRRIRGLEIKLP